MPSAPPSSPPKAGWKQISGSLPPPKPSYWKPIGSCANQSAPVWKNSLSLTMWRSKTYPHPSYSPISYPFPPPQLRPPPMPFLFPAFDSVSPGWISGSQSLPPGTPKPPLYPLGSPYGSPADSHFGASTSVLIPSLPKLGSNPTPLVLRKVATSARKSSPDSAALATSTATSASLAPITQLHPHPTTAQRRTVRSWEKSAASLLSLTKPDKLL